MNFFSSYAYLTFTIPLSLPPCIPLVRFFLDQIKYVCASIYCFYRKLEISYISVKQNTVYVQRKSGDLYLIKSKDELFSFLISKLLHTETLHIYFLEFVLGNGHRGLKAEGALHIVLE